MTKRPFLRHLSLRACALQHDLPTLTKHCVGARISSFRLFAIVPTSSENSFRTLLGVGFALATRSTSAQRQSHGANLALEAAKLAARTTNLAAKTANLAAQTAPLAVPRPCRTQPGASLSRPRAPRTAGNRFCIDFFVVLHRFLTAFSSISH